MPFSLACPVERVSAVRRGLFALLLWVPMSAIAGDIEAYRAALKAGDAIELQRLIAAEEGAPPLASRGETILHLATSHNHADNRPRLIKVLLDAGMPVDSRDKTGLTPLHWAAGYGCIDCVVVLLAAGADPQARRNDGATALHRAAQETAPLLLKAGADPTARDKYDRVPLHTTYNAIKELLVVGVDVRDRHGMTPLHYAALNGNLDQVNWLLAQGANPAIQSTSPFHFNGDEPPDSWEPRHTFDAGTRPYDIAKWQHKETRWSSGRYRGIVEKLDAVTPRRGWLSR